MKTLSILHQVNKEEIKKIIQKGEWGSFKEFTINQAPEEIREVIAERLDAMEFEIEWDSDKVLMDSREPGKIYKQVGDCKCEKCLPMLKWGIENMKLNFACVMYETFPSRWFLSEIELMAIEENYAGRN